MLTLAGVHAQLAPGTGVPLMLGGYFGNCELIAYGFKAALHNGEGRDSHRAGAALGRAAWGRSPLSAMGTP